MNFHAKALLAFIDFHVIFTGGGLVFDDVPQSLGQGDNDNDVFDDNYLGRRVASR